MQGAKLVCLCSELQVLSNSPKPPQDNQSARLIDERERGAVSVVVSSSVVDSFMIQKPLVRFPNPQGYGTAIVAPLLLSVRSVICYLIASQVSENQPAPLQNCYSDELVKRLFSDMTKLFASPHRHSQRGTAVPCTPY